MMINDDENAVKTVSKCLASMKSCWGPEFELGHIDKLRMLRIRVYWGARLEPVDPHMTST